MSLDINQAVESSNQSQTDNKKAFSDCAYGDRDKLALSFTRYLNSRNTDKGAYVTNLNGAWGTGKTFFVDNWCEKLKEKKVLAIKIDAWESDYLKDPLAILVAELLEQVKDQSGLTDFAEKEVQVIKYGLRLIKNAAPTILMALGKHFLGDDWQDILQELGANLKDQTNESTEPDSKKLGDFGKEIFATHTKHKEFVVEFKKSFIQLLNISNEALASKSDNNDANIDKIKTYIFIDELDRCRPTYAIEMLETVKHLFNIPNLVFVLSTDTAQLEHSIKAVYGEGFDAREYLSRFFEQRLLLPAPDHFTFLKSKNSFASLGLNDDSQHLFPAIDTKEKVSAVLGMFCEINQISLRRTLQLADKLEMILLDVISKEFDASKQINLFELVACLITREFYFDHGERQIWLSTYKVLPPESSNTYKSDPRIKFIDELNDKVSPLFKITKNSNNITNLNLIEDIIGYTINVREIKDTAPANTIVADKILGDRSKSGHEDYKTLFDQTFSSCFNKINNKSSFRDNKFNFINKNEIDNLVTLNSMQFEVSGNIKDKPFPLHISF